MTDLLGPFGVFHSNYIYKFNNYFDNTELFGEFFKSLSTKSSLQEKMVLLYILIKFYKTNLDDILILMKSNLSNHDLLKSFVQKYNLKPDSTVYYNPRKTTEIADLIKFHLGLPIDLLLDVGCGDGKVMRELKTKGVAKNVVGIEIPEWSKIKHNSNSNILFIEPENPVFKIEDESVDVAICIYTLHHFTALDKMLKEISRCIKKNGYILVLDHDINNKEQASLLDLVHIFYEFNREHKFPNKETYFSRYYNISAWNDILLKNRFKNIIASHELSVGEPTIINHMMKFYAIYQKL